MNLLRRNDSDGKIDWLASHPWWCDLPKEDLQVLASTGDRTRQPAGRVLMTEGQRGLESAVVVDGEVEVVHEGQVVATLGPGDVVGELSLLDGVPRTADVRTSTDVELLVFSTQGLRRVLHASSVVREQVLLAAAEHRSFTANPSSRPDGRGHFLDGSTRSTGHASFPEPTHGRRTGRRHRLTGERGMTNVGSTTTKPSSDTIWRRLLAYGTAAVVAAAATLALAPAVPSHSFSLTSVDGEIELE